MQQAKWSVSFAVSLTKLGDVQGTVAVKADTVDIKINMQQAATLLIINKYQQEMDEVLQSLGLKLGDWKLQLGLDNNQIDVKNLRLLDIRI